MFASSLLAAVLAFAGTSFGAAIKPRNFNSHSATVRQIFRAEPHSFFENVAVRKNGNLLVSRLDIPSLYQFDPKTGDYSIIVNFTSVTATFGIAEYAPDVFAVAIGNYSTTTKQSTPGTWSVVTVDLSKGLDSHGKITPSPLAKVPNAANLNGLTFRAPSTFYAADATGFQIWGIDIASTPPHVQLAVPRNELFENGGPGRSPLGINGLKWDERDQQLVFTNSNKMFVGKVPVNGTGFGAPSKIARLLSMVDTDDLDVDPSDGSLYVANKVNGIEYVSRDGKTQFAVNVTNSVEVDGPTAAKFGRGANANVLYVTTAGRDANLTEVGGQVLSYTFDCV